MWWGYLAVHNMRVSNEYFKHVKCHVFFVTSTWRMCRTKYVKLLAATTKGDLREGKQQNGAKSADDKKASTAAGNGKADKEATKEEEGEAEDKTEKQEKTGEDPQEQTAAGEQEAAEVEAEEGKDAEEKAPEKE